MPQIVYKHGDCLEKLKEMPNNSVNAIVTDPPYGLSFMGKKWDYDVPSKEIWKECLKVLKPGGHALIACGTRTQHRMAVNLEDAGFEIRDIVAWVYGSGFPKSLDIGKQVDKIQGNEREDLGEYDPRSLIDGANRQDRAIGGQQVAPSKTSKLKLTKGTSEWEGWGTALKPAMELWTLVRKPLSEKNIAENVLKHGTGGLNIDGCRVPFKNEYDKQQAESIALSFTGKTFDTGKYNMNVGHSFRREAYDSSKGRFPANIIHDGSDEVVALFPDEDDSESDGTVQQTLLGGIAEDKNMSASRFFYCAKAGKEERNEGLEGFEEKQKSGAEFRPNHQEKALLGEDGNPYGRWNKIKNNHPTVKPVALMRYLCRLITPPKGIVLDPFMGSGSTGVGAIQEGFSFMGIEREAEYCKIAQARIDFAMAELEHKNKQQNILNFIDKKRGDRP
jgi:site-specific DNA-methyltransferase (adenine-specific)